MLGTAKLNRLDGDAPKYFRRYISHFRGSSYLKQSYQKIAWHNLLQGDIAAYQKYIARVKLVGSTVVDGDANAQKESESGQVPNVNLLCARVLFDGGYYDRAYAILRAKSVEDFSSKLFKLEYHYRLGRITHKMGLTTEALSFYQKAIDEGREEPWFYACNAALQIGLIHEAAGRSYQARQYFQLCLDIDPEDYRNSLHHKAKAGLNRL
jgi:tetratricopeptide (TPR) repeat protein